MQKGVDIIWWDRPISYSWQHYWTQELDVGVYSEFQSHSY